MNALLEVLVYGMALAIMGGTLATLLRRSEYGVLIAVSDMPFCLGALLYPVLLMIGAISPGQEGEAFLARNGMPGMAAAAHVLCYAIGCAAGLRLGRRLPLLSPARLVTISNTVAPRFGDWGLVLGVGLALWAVFFVEVGLDTALAGASSARAGEFEDFAGVDQFLFLKTLASMGLYAVCIVPVALRRGRWLLLALFVASVALFVLNSVSRSAVLVYLITPLLMYAYGRPGRADWQRLALVALAAVAGVFVLLYGKSIGGAISTLIKDTATPELDAYQYSGNVFEAYLRNVEFVWFSIQAGIDHFLDAGALLPDDVLLSTFGVLPSWLMDSAGLAAFDYRTTDLRLACVNAEAFSPSLDCTIPPLWTGFSAYTLPVAGGLVFGALRYVVFGVLERAWLGLRQIDAYHTWIVYFLTLVGLAYMSLIPSSIANASFAVALLALVALVKAALVSGARAVLSPGSR